MINRCDIVDALSDLSYRDRKIVGIWLDELPDAETATLLDTTPKSIERRWQRMRTQMRDVLEPR